jgi:hypothetical protein
MPIRFVQVQGVQEGFQLVEDGSEPLPVRGPGVEGGEIDLAGQFVEFVPGEPDGLRPSGTTPDLVSEPNGVKATKPKGPLALR